MPELFRTTKWNIEEEIPKPTARRFRSFFPFQLPFPCPGRKGHGLEGESHVGLVRLELAERFHAARGRDDGDLDVAVFPHALAHRGQVAVPGALRTTRHEGQLLVHGEYGGRENGDKAENRQGQEPSHNSSRFGFQRDYLCIASIAPHSQPPLSLGSGKGKRIGAFRVFTHSFFVTRNCNECRREGPGRNHACFASIEYPFVEAGNRRWIIDGVVTNICIRER